MARGMVAATVAAAFAGACGRLGFEPGGPGGGPATDGSVADTAAGDAPLGPFGAPTQIAELSDSSGDDDPTLTADQLELYFGTGRGAGDMNIFRSVRSSVGAAWGAPEAVAELNSGGSDENPGVTPDGLAIYVSSDRGGVGLDIWISTRPDRVSAWGAPVLVNELNSSFDDLGVEPRSATHLVFYRVEGNRQLYEATRASAIAPWTVAPISELDTTEQELSPFLGSELELYFASDRPGAQSRDLFVARRPALGMPFGSPERLVELVSAGRDDDPWLSPDQRTIYFSSDRLGNDEIFSASR